MKNPLLKLHAAVLNTLQSLLQFIKKKDIFYASVSPEGEFIPHLGLSKRKCRGFDLLHTSGSYKSTVKTKSIFFYVMAVFLVHTFMD